MPFRVITVPGDTGLLLVMIGGGHNTRVIAVEHAIRMSMNLEDVLHKQIGFVHGVQAVIGISTKQDHVPGRLTGDAQIVQLVVRISTNQEAVPGR